MTSTSVQLRDASLARLLDAEWLLTNGLGGFAMGSVDGVPRRRYHAWLVAAASPPLGRHVLLHSCAEWIVLDAEGDSRRIALSAYEFEGGVRGPADGLARLRSFTRTEQACEWTYAIPSLNATVSRTLEVLPLSNQGRLRYEVSGVPAGARLEIRPFTPLRDFHEVEWARESVPFSVQANERRGEVVIRRDRLAAAMWIQGAGGAFIHEPQWWHRFEYRRDLDRGQYGYEDLPSAGVWSMPLRFDASTKCELAFALIDPAMEAETPRPRTPSREAKTLPPALLEAASQFVVRRESRDAAGNRRTRASIIAGYPWFSDWGRDTCISLPGLLICTGRLEEARECLEAFAELVEGGLVPNCFDNGSGRPEYNTADASLWYLNAACEWAAAAGVPLDPAGDAATIARACLSIIEAYEHGTAYGIGMDQADGLIAAGNVGTQLTWMDAKRDGVVFTPRHGKPVELSALWHNGLRRVASLLPSGEAGRVRSLREIAEWVERSFSRAFWNAEAKCLFDCLSPATADGAVVGWTPSRHIRPNQIFAVSLLHSPLAREHRADVLACVTRELLTPHGLRTLARREAEYRPRYEGSLFDRDGAYHNGTVWPWLIGPYAEAVLRVGGFSVEARARAREVVQPLLDILCGGIEPSGPVGQLCEIYDAEPPRRPEGCPAQAWSVAEVLRVTHLINAPSVSEGGANA